MSDTNTWTSRHDAYNVIYRYPGAFGITQFTWGPGLWYIVARTIENGIIKYSIYGSDCKIEIDPEDLSAMNCFNELYNQMTGQIGSGDPNQYIDFIDLSPINV